MVQVIAVEEPMGYLGTTKNQFEPVFFQSINRSRLVLNSPVLVPQYLGSVWTSCGCWLPHLGIKNQTELDLQTLSRMVMSSLSPPLCTPMHRCGCLTISITSVGKCKNWLNPADQAEISNTNSCTHVKKLIKDGHVIIKPTTVHSHAQTQVPCQCWQMQNLAQPCQTS